jgi:hypothetical protein
MRREQQEMGEEEELSRLSEEQYKEELERRLWKEKEAVELAAWEALQRERDEAENAARAARAVELEVLLLCALFIDSLTYQSFVLISSVNDDRQRKKSLPS